MIFYALHEEITKEVVSRPGAIALAAPGLSPPLCGSLRRGSKVGCGRRRNLAKQRSRGEVQKRGMDARQEGSDSFYRRKLRCDGGGRVQDKNGVRRV